MPAQPSKPATHRWWRLIITYAGRLVQALPLLILVPALSGCMEALQTGERPATAPPSALALPPSLAPPTLPPINTSASYAPDPATAAPTIPPTSSLPTPSEHAASVTPAQRLPLLVITASPLSNEQRWRSQQIDRHSFENLRSFTTTGSELWWYDPLNQQSVILGRISGDFAAQAEFTLRGLGVPALEVPYQLNQGYGLTALSPALIERMHRAGYTEWIETYVFLTPDVVAR